jgi:hypothetical protein
LCVGSIGIEVRRSRCWLPQIQHARERGGETVDGCVTPSSPSHGHTGFIGLLEEAGFEEVGREGKPKVRDAVANGRVHSDA